MLDAVLLVVGCAFFVVAILYTVDAGDSLEFCGLLTDTPDQDGA